MESRIHGHAAVRAALRDTDSYSSDLQGDADVRDYRQIPLEVDPPRHHAYRSALNPLFVRPRIESLYPEFSAFARDLVSEYEQARGGNFINHVALPYVVRCLTTIYGRPQDFAEWMSWGADVWIQTPTGRSGDALHGYLNRMFDEASDSVENTAWTFLRQLNIDGQPLSRTEFVGAGSVMLAGGRDTVVKLISFSIFHLLKHADDAQALRNGEVTLPAAIAEFLRFLTPLPAMKRVAPHAKGLSDEERSESDFVTVDFASANHDDAVFDSPDVVNIYRQKIAHVAFGFGPHTCIGNHVAELETKALLEVVLPQIDGWKLESEEITWQAVSNSQHPVHLAKVNIRCNQ